MQLTPQDHRSDVSNDDRRRDDNDDRARVEASAVPAATPDPDVLDGLAERPTHEHAAVYEQLHAQLQNALSEIDDA